MPLLDIDYIRDLAVSFPHLPGEMPRPPIAIGEVWWLLTAASVLVAGFFFLGALRALGARSIDARTPDSPAPGSADGAQRLFLIAWFILAAASMLNPWRGVGACDRYFLPGLAPFLLILGLEAKAGCTRKSFAIAAAGTLCFWGFGLVCLQDYLAWNRAAWAAQDKLVTTHGVTPDRIRGEDTFQGWHNSEAYMRKYQTRNFWEANLTRLGPWTFDDEFVVTAADARPGYSEFEAFTYFTWLGMGERSVRIFHRNRGKPSITLPGGSDP